MAQSTSSRAAIFLLKEFVGDVLYWPVWWYSRGLIHLVNSLVRSWLRLVDHLSLVILFRTIGKPMYGDYTRSGKVISFFFRIFLIVTRLVVLVAWTMVNLILLVIWLAGPVVTGAMLLRQAIPLNLNPT